MTSASSAQGFLRMSFGTLYQFAPAGRKNLFTRFNKIPGCEFAKCFYDPKLDVSSLSNLYAFVQVSKLISRQLFEITCRSDQAENAFATFTQTVLDFVPEELFRADQNDERPNVTRMRASRVDDDEFDLEDKDQSEIDETEEPGTIAGRRVAHMVRAHKDRASKVQFFQLRELLDGTLTRTLVDPTSQMYDFGGNPGSAISRAFVCRYMLYDASKYAYSLQQRVLAPVGEPDQDIDLWSGMCYREVGNVSPDANLPAHVPEPDEKLPPHSPEPAGKPVAAVTVSNDRLRQWLKTSTQAVANIDTPNGCSTPSARTMSHVKTSPISGPASVGPSTKDQQSLAAPHKKTDRSESSQPTTRTWAATAAPKQAWEQQKANDAWNNKAVSTGDWVNSAPFTMASAQFPPLRQSQRPMPRNNQTRPTVMPPPALVPTIGNFPNSASGNNNGSIRGGRTHWPPFSQRIPPATRPATIWSQASMPTGQVGSYPARGNMASFGRGKNTPSGRGTSDRGNDTVPLGRGGAFQRPNVASDNLRSLQSPPNGQRTPIDKAQNPFGVLIDYEIEEEVPPRAGLSMTGSAASTPPDASSSPEIDLIQLNDDIVDVDVRSQSVLLPSLTFTDLSEQSDEVVAVLHVEDERDKMIFRRTMRQRKPPSITAPGTVKPSNVKTGAAFKAWVQAELAAEASARASKVASFKGTKSAVEPVETPTPADTYPDAAATLPEPRTLQPQELTPASDATPATEPVQHSSLFHKLRSVWTDGIVAHKTGRTLCMQLGKAIFSEMPKALKKTSIDPDEMISTFLDADASPTLHFMTSTSVSTRDMQYIVGCFRGKDNTLDQETSAYYEFTCRLDDLTRFDVVVDAVKDVRPVVYASKTTLASVYVHFPQRVWDARLTVKDVVSKDPKEYPAASRLIESLYVRKLDGCGCPEIKGRDGHGLFIESVHLLTRSTFRKPGAKTFLAITRVLDLNVGRPSKSTDGEFAGLFRACASDDVEMARQHRFWYEVSLSVEDVPEGLSEDEAERTFALYIGELEEEAEKLVIKMDGVGYANEGLGARREHKMLVAKKKAEEVAMEKAQSKW